MEFRKIEIRRSRATLLIVALALTVFVAISLAFHPWGFGWFAWGALGLAAIIVLPNELLRVVPDDDPVSVIWYYALLFCWVTFAAAITDAPSLSFFIIGFGGIFMLPNLIELAIGGAPSTADAPREPDPD